MHRYFKINLIGFGSIFINNGFIVYANIDLVEFSVEQGLLHLDIDYVLVTFTKKYPVSSFITKQVILQSFI